MIPADLNVHDVPLAVPISEKDSRGSWVATNRSAVSAVPTCVTQRLHAALRSDWFHSLMSGVEVNVVDDHRTWPSSLQMQVRVRAGIRGQEVPCRRG